MRLFAVVAAFFCLGLGSVSAASPGAYTNTSASDAVDCVKLCEGDSLCVGWTFSAGACGLWASVPSTAGESFTLSSRAPGFARAIAPAEVVADSEPPPHAPPHRVPPSETLLGGSADASDLRPRLGDRS